MPDRNSNLEPELRELPSYAEHYATMLGAIYGREGWQALNSRFSLFSFAIYDASIHTDFDQQVKQLLFSGDSETLEDDFIGFLALADPWDYELPDDERWRERRRVDREQSDNLAAYNRKCAIPLIHSIVRTDSAIAAGALAAVLSIPQDRLPCIVVSSNLRSSRLAWFSTDRTWLGDQLHHLRDVSQIVREFGTFGRERIIHEHIRQTNGYGGQGVVRLLGESSFGAQLFTFMNATVAGHSPFETHKTKALEQTKKQLQSLQEDMKSAKEKLNANNEKLCNLESTVQKMPETDDTLRNLKKELMEQSADLKEGLIEFNDIFEGCSHYIAFILASLQAPHDIKSDVDEATLEEETIQMLKTAYAVLDMLKKYKSIGLDYTPAVMCFAKVFEREINLSVVHWVRAQLSIDLPAFFDRFQSGGVATVDKVNFNIKGTHGKDSWRAPMLGESKITIDKSAIIPPTLAKWCMLSKMWDKIIKNRNDGAHKPVVDECVAKEIKEALETLICSGVFDELHKIKTQLRGAGEIDVPDAGLRKVIEDKFYKVTKEELCITRGKIKERDMARLCTNGQFFADGKNFVTKIKDLTGLEKTNGLEKLRLANNEIEDLKALEKLTSLKELSLENNSIKNIQPLKDLKALEKLDLENNKIEDLKALEKLNNLKFLNLKDNCINKSEQKTTLDTLQSRGCEVLL